MDDICLLVDKYTNLLRSSSEIGTEFTQELRAQQLVFRLVRLLGIYRMLTLTSTIGEIHRITPEEVRVTLFGKTTLHRSNR